MLIRTPYLLNSHFIHFWEGAYSQTRSSLLMVDLKDDKLLDSGKVVGVNEFHSGEVLGMKDL